MGAVSCCVLLLSILMIYIIIKNICIRIQLQKQHDNSLANEDELKKQRNHAESVIVPLPQITAIGTGNLDIPFDYEEEMIKKVSYFIDKSIPKSDISNIKRPDIILESEGHNMDKINPSNTIKITRKDTLPINMSTKGHEFVFDLV